MLKILVALAVLLAGLATSGPDPRPGLAEARAYPTPSPGCGASGEPKAAAPTLDLESLERRLRETKAIGFFTKLSLKNQVDDLVGRFRRFHDGIRGVTLEELRERYNLLLLKVLSLLQKDDPKLSQDIAASREAIWDLLADPDKFRTLSKEAKS